MTMYYELYKVRNFAVGPYGCTDYTVVVNTISYHLYKTVGIPRSESMLIGVYWYDMSTTVLSRALCEQ